MFLILQYFVPHLQLLLEHMLYGMYDYPYPEKQNQKLNVPKRQQFALGLFICFTFCFYEYLLKSNPKK